MALGPRGPCLPLPLLLPLLLPLIGAALSQAAGSAPTEATGTSPPGPTDGVPAWRLADQRDLGVCLHIYLERDYPMIEQLVNSAPDRALIYDSQSKDDCHHVSRMVRCLTRSLSRMQYYENFSEYRRLVVALDAVLLELCGTVGLMRHQFIPLLRNLVCIDKVRTETSECRHDHLPQNVWHQLVRLEADSTLCWPMSRQLNCLTHEGLIRQNCGEQAQHLFTNISSIFLRHWCYNAGSNLSQIPFILKMLVVLLSLLPLFSFMSI